MKFRTINIALVVMLATLWILAPDTWTWKQYTLYSLLVLFIYSLFIAFGSYYMKANFFFKSIHSNKKGLCLTFDDGPHPEHTPQVLDILASHNLKATFFVIGKQIEGNEAILQRMVAEGHVIGNHTWSHSNMTAMMLESTVDKEIKQTNEAIFKACGVKPIIFRPPFGVTNPRIGKAIKSNLMHSIGWDIRSYDTTAKSTDQLKTRILKEVDRGGSILLMHDNRPIAAEVLDELLAELKSKNVVFADKVTG
jgi:peptidoglycan/xylan/chitin deacetylase (PgdA/CDA1 family)